MEISADAIWLVTMPLDIRTGADGLSLYVQQELGRPPCDGAVYVFTNHSRTRLKLVCWDGTGAWLCVRRLHQGRFIWPKAGDTSWRMTPEQWRWLVAGVDWQRLSAQPPAAWKL